MRLNNRRTARGKALSLTSREIEVLTWVARGKSAWEIGEILDIAKRTVDEHVQTAVRKIGAVNRTHAAALAVRDRLRVTCVLSSSSVRWSFAAITRA